MINATVSRAVETGNECSWKISCHLVFKIHAPTAIPPELPNIILTEASASIPWAQNFDVDTSESCGKNLSKHKYAWEHLYNVHMPVLDAAASIRLQGMNILTKKPAVGLNFRQLS
jgi:hypothetical protein